MTKKLETIKEKSTVEADIIDDVLNANIDYLSAYIGANPERYKCAEIERSGGELSHEGIRVITSN